MSYGTGESHKTASHAGSRTGSTVLPGHFRKVENASLQELFLFGNNRGSFGYEKLMFRHLIGHVFVIFTIDVCISTERI